MSHALSPSFARSRSDAADRSPRSPSMVDTRASAEGEEGRQISGPPWLTRGATVGRYVVLGRVGAGGMGEVFAAYDPDLDRRVALKVLRSAARRDASEGHARLLREAKAMAKVVHEHVIAVHDVGTVQDRVFIAMEFIQGRTIAAWVDQAQPSTGEVVEVFVAAGKGLAAAHACGLIHRDFKPDNVLLGDDGRVCVVDFGLARSREGLERSRGEWTDPVGRAVTSPALSLDTDVEGPGTLTRTGAVVGTPAYMAPEQHLGAPATDASDQFSFCVSLFEALYGQRPFAGNTHAELVFNLSEGRVRPTPPGVVVPGWLRKIVMRGLALQPERRFASMQALVTALGRGRPSRRRRLQALVASAALTMVAASVAVLGAAPAAARCDHGDVRLAGVWDDAAQRRYAHSFARVDKPFVGDVWDRVSTELDGYTQRWVAARTDACEATHVRGEQSEARLDLRIACLDRQLDGLRAVTELYVDADADVVAGAVDGLAALPDPGACATVHRDDAAQRTDAVATVEREHLARANALVDAHRIEPALGRIEQVLAEAVRSGRDELRARALLVRARAEDAAGRVTAARSTAKQAVLAAETAGDVALMADAWTDRVWLDGYRGADIAAGVEAAAHAHALLSQRDEDPESLALLVGHEGDVAYVAGDYATSLARHQRVLQLREQLDGCDHPRTADAHTGIAHAMVELGRYGDALGHYSAALTIFETAYGSRHPYLAHALTNVGVTLEYLHQLREARAAHERALQVAQGAHGTRHPSVAEVLNNYASVLHQQGELGRARATFERAESIWTEVYGAEHPDVAMAHFNLAIVVEAQGDTDGAERLHRRALQARERALGAEHPDVADSLHHLGELLALGAPGDLDRHEEAAALLRRALTIRSHDFGADAAETRQTQAIVDRVSVAP